MNSTTGKSMVQEMGIAGLVLLMVTNAWLLVSNINIHNSEGDRLKRIEQTRFTAADGAALREIVLENRRETLKNRKILEKLESQVQSHLNR